MPGIQAQFSNAQQVSEPPGEPAQLATVVRIMTREIQRLHDDNLQLRAAVKIYKEVVRQYALKAG
jgi:hypothetical protein